MKRTINIIALFFIAATLNAQMKIEKHLNFSGKSSVKLDIQIADSINLQTWNKNEVFVSASVSINENKDNDAYYTSFEEAGTTTYVKAGFKDNYFNDRRDNHVKSDIYWNIYIPEKAAFSVESINADITITGDTGPMKVKSISGFIDVKVPEKRPADIEFSTISGTVYSNHLLTLDDSRSGIPSRIRQKLNNGGDRISLETISGDIFFRK